MGYYTVSLKEIDEREISREDLQVEYLMYKQSQKMKALESDKKNGQTVRSVNHKK